jgi:hypothetical protein
MHLYTINGTFHRSSIKMGICVLDLNNLNFYAMKLTENLINRIATELYNL